MNKRQYYIKVCQIIDHYNYHQLFEQGQLNSLLQALSALDNQFFDIDKKVLMSRHGLCSPLQKIFGANPNAGLEPSAMNHMKKTPDQTANLLRPGKIVKFISSPMRRSLQSAACLLPNDLTALENFSFEEDPVLAENSEDLSGKNIKSFSGLVSHMFVTLPYDTLRYMFKPKLSMPFRFLVGLLMFPIRVLETLISLMLWPGYGEDINKDIQNAHENILNKMGDGHNLASQPNSSMSEFEKIKGIESLICEGNEDLWLFGHGKNFKTFFSEKLAIQDGFDYADIRTVYRLADGTYAAAPYVLHVDQKFGYIVPRGLECCRAGLTETTEEIKGLSDRVIQGSSTSTVINTLLNNEIRETQQFKLKPEHKNDSNLTEYLLEEDEKNFNSVQKASNGFSLK